MKNYVIEISKSIGIFFLYLLLPFIFVLPITLLNINMETSSFLFKNFFNTLIYLVLLIVLIIIFRKTMIESFRDFKRNYKTIIRSAFKYWGLGFMVMAIINIILNLLIFKNEIAVNEELNRALLKELPYFAIITMVLLTPFIEELTFRLNFRKIFKNENYFAIFSGVLFGLMHALNSFETFDISEIKYLLYILPYGTLGFALAKSYTKTNNIFTAILAHAFHNFLTISLLFLGGF